MTALIELREKIKSFYAKYDIYILPIIKFALAMVLFIEINSRMGYFAIFNNLFVVTVLALICAVLPLNGMVMVGGVMVVCHCFGVGVEVGGFALLLYLLLFLLYFRFVPEDALALLLTPLSFVFHIPGAIPLGLGLLRGPLSAISGVFGVVSWHFMKMVAVIAERKSAGDVSALDLLKEMLQGLFSNGELLLSVIACAAVILVVAAIRKLCTTYPWEIAIGVGSGIYILVMFLGVLFVQTDMSIIVLIAGTVGAAVISLILEFFVYSVDYAGSQYLQFEDDEYFYYVKAIPKRILPRSEYEEDEEVEEEKFPTAPIQVQDISAVPDIPGDVEAKFEDVDFEAKLEESLKNL